MSGIVAVFRTDGREIDPALLQRMSDKMAHRGPDGEGFWTDGSIGLAHRLLHTTPESLSERQPTVDGHGRCRLVFDGRVDNREELTAALGNRVAQDAAGEGGVTDPGLIIQAYSKWGTACLEKIVGEFAFALWDEKRRNLWCARDRMGLRPLHYRWDGFAIWVSSEIKPLLDVSGRQPEPDDEMILAFLLREFREEDEQKTFFREIRRLPPAHFLLVDKRGLKISRYWEIDPARQTRYLREEDYVEHFLALFKEAVKCRTRSAHRVGALLSGGLDSSSIVCMAAQLSNVPIETFTIYGDHPDSDERRYSREVANAVRLTAHEFCGARADPLEGLDQDLDCIECPVIATNRSVGRNLLELIHSRDCRVFLSGVGGDQILDEYGHPADILRSFRPWRYVSELRVLAEACGGDPWEFAMMSLQNLAPQPLKYWGKRILRGIPPYWINSKLAREVCLRERIRRPRHSLRFPSYSQGESYLLTFSPYRVLTFEVDERATAHQGMEVRYPYLDSRLVEFVLSIPQDKRTRNGERKYLLRRAMCGILPETIRLRKGKGDYTDEMDQSLMILCRQNPPAPLANYSGRMERYLDLKGAQELVERFVQGERDCRHTIWFIITLDRWLMRFWNGGHNGEEKGFDKKALQVPQTALLR